MSDVRTDLFCGIFDRQTHDGLARITPRAVPPPSSIPDPRTGRRLRISTLQAGTPAICPACLARALGGFVSFVDDQRIAYACPQCEKLVWIKGC
jgi:hypothetical protein